MEIEDIIKNESQNQICLDQISELMKGDPEPDSRAGVMLNILSIAVEAFEKKRYPIGNEELKEQELKEQELWLSIQNHTCLQEGKTHTIFEPPPGYSREEVYNCITKRHPRGVIYRSDKGDADKWVSLSYPLA